MMFGQVEGLPGLERELSLAERMAVLAAETPWLAGRRIWLYKENLLVCYKMHSCHFS